MNDKSAKKILDCFALFTLEDCVKKSLADVHMTGGLQTSLIGIEVARPEFQGEEKKALPILTTPVQ